jgi:phosphohistidine swiveling domain-containing protein
MVAFVHDLLGCESAPELILQRAGGKGRSLYALSKAGFEVPTWVVVSSEVCARFLAEADIANAADRLVHGVAGEAAETAAAGIAKLYDQAQLPPTTTELIAKAYELVGGGAVAVRSSGVEEDGKEHSFAGQYNSYLNVVGLPQVEAAVKRCWASAFTARSLSYRLSHGITPRPLPMAVIIQRMITAQVSGVAFTQNPTTAASNEVVISAVDGLGEGLVSGHVDADTLVIDRDTLVTLRTTVGEKSERIVPATDGGGVEIQPNSRESEAVCLSEDQAIAIAKTAVDVEALFKAPQDIEWSIDGDKLWLLQARPITTRGLCNQTGFGGHLWENSNIIENFSGVTSPLTFSFARDVYHQIYLEYARLLGVPRDQLLELNEWLHHMLGHHNGRVYYDLLNWYKIVRLVPFYAVNRRMLDLAIGVEVPLHDATAERLQPMPTVVGGRAAAVRLRSAGLFFWHFLTIGRAVRAFVRDFNDRHSAVEALPLRSMSAEQIHDALRKARRDFVPRWGRMILLEQTIGLSVGVLAVLVRRWLPDAGEGLLFELMRPGEKLDSVLPVTRMKEIADRLRTRAAVLAEVQEGPVEGLLDRLRSSAVPGASELVAEIESYIADFGYRSLNELKLEEPDLSERPGSFFLMLRAHLSEQSSVATTGSRDDAEAVLRYLPAWKRFVLGVVRRKVQRCLAARERVRFCRTRAFGTVRRMIKAMGANLAERGFIGRADDIFLLRLDELRDWAAGVLPQDDLAALISHRSVQLDEYRKQEAPSRFVTSGFIGKEAYASAGWHGADHREHEAAEVGSVFKGTPCCAGHVVGEAAVVTEPLNVSGRILVTYRTDPGWCAALPTASALLIERGSPLTHVAIVARELGIPTIIQVKDVTRRIKTGMQLDVNGALGSVTILQPANSAPSAPSHARSEVS